jgi:hypothetical protein
MNGKQHRKQTMTSLRWSQALLALILLALLLGLWAWLWMAR